MKPKEKILIVTSESKTADAFRLVLEHTYTVETAATGTIALDKTQRESYLAVILDLVLPGNLDGLDTLKKIRIQDPAAGVLMISSVQSIKTAVQAMKLGAYDYCLKPVDAEDVVLTIERLAEKKRLQTQADFLTSQEFKEAIGFGEIIGTSPQMQEVFRIMEQMQKSETPVLIQGAAGTGKTLMAQGIHFNGQRQAGPFITVLCNAIVREQLEAEFFGQEKPFRKGACELAAHGTLYLNEVSALPLDFQGKLEKALADGAFRRVGGTRAVPSHARVIASCGVDLRTAVDRGLFRRELYYRLNVVPLFLAPLAQRKGDLPLLVNHFINVYNRRFDRKFKSITPAALASLEKYSWPGNVRELAGVMERIIALNNEENIHENLLPLEVVVSFQDIISKIDDDSTTAEVSLKEARQEFEKRMLIAFMKRFRGNQSKISRILEVHRNTILNKVKDFELNPKDFRRKRPAR
jgi:DNA-binding NtrC family response regulator